MVKKSKSNKSKLKPTKKPREIGGVDGPDPTRYGDWEKRVFVTTFSLASIFN